MAGRTISCPTCGAEHQVPEAEAAEPAAVDAQEPVQTAPSPAEAEASGASAPPAREAAPVRFAAPARPRDDDDEEADDDDAPLLRGFDRESDEMDLTPMVDCVFLLLIFFMITASFSIQKTIEVPPPDPEKKGAAQSFQTLDDLERTSVIVQIDERNTIFVDDVPLGDPNALADTLRDKMYTEQKNELVVEAHARAFHETVVAVVDAANEVQFQKVRLATSPGSEPD